MKRLRYLQDAWDTRATAGLDEPELLRSSKVRQKDSLTDENTEMTEAFLR
jgi:hypothetical protein